MLGLFFSPETLAMKKVQMPESKVNESEEQLVSRAQEAVSQCRWVVGECATKWTERYARGRTDADFASLIGLTADQVYQRRRVWETFAGVRGEFTTLKWSHFYASLNWDDATDCLRWAEETRSTVAEMRAWRRARRGEDLTIDAAEEAVGFIPAVTEFVREPAENAAAEVGTGRPATGDARAVLAGLARQSGEGEREIGDEYTPFHSGAITPPPRHEHAEVAAAPSEPPTTEQHVRRLTNSLERFVKAMTPQFRRDFRKLPAEVKERFHQAVGELTSHVAELS
jgi:hypothetical protein